MQEVVKQLSERLVNFGHEVTIATTEFAGRKDSILKGVRIVEFDITGNLVNGLKGEIEKYREFLLSSDYDIITNFAAQQWATDIALPLLDKITAKKVFVPTGFSGLFDPLYKKYFIQMKNWMRQYDMNIFLSDNYRDINFARENEIVKNTLIPNGAAEEEFLSEDFSGFRKSKGIPEDAFLILHVGSYTPLKGHREALEIFYKAAIPNSFLLMVGNGNEKYIKQNWKKLTLKTLLKYFFGKSQKVKLTSLSREETVKAYLAADMFLFPSNVECSPIVLFECMASKTPFVVTDVGNSAEIIKWSDAGILLPTTFEKNGNSHACIPESASMLKQLYQDQNKREIMKRNGFFAWKKEFTWSEIAKKYESVYSSLIGENK